MLFGDYFVQPFCRGNQMSDETRPDVKFKIGINGTNLLLNVIRLVWSLSGIIITSSGKKE